MVCLCAVLSYTTIGDTTLATIEFAGWYEGISSAKRWEIAHRSTGSFVEAKAFGRQDTAGSSRYD